jgi:sugar diacid utilization regulator
LYGDPPYEPLEHVDALQELIDDVGRLLGGTVTCSNMNRELLAATPVGEDVDPVRQRYILRRVAPLSADEQKLRERYMPLILHSDWPIKVPASPDIGYSGRIIMRVALDGDAFGVLSVAEAGRVLGQQDYALIRDAAQAAARILSKRHAAQREASHLRREFLEDIVHGRMPDAGSLRAGAIAIGLQVDGTQQVVVVAIANPASLRVGVQQQPPSPQRRSRKRLEEIVRLEAAAVDSDMLFATHETSMVVLVNLDSFNASDRPGVCLDLATRIIHRVPAFLSGVTVSVGIGRQVQSFDQVAESFRQAQLAAQLATSVLGGSRAIHYDNLGVYRLLYAIKAQEHVVPEALQRVADYDLKHNTEYVATLAAYFGTMGRLTLAAERLRIHRRTLEYRMSRIEAISGISPDDPEQRLVLELGIKLLELDSIPPLPR